MQLHLDNNNEKEFLLALLDEFIAKPNRWFTSSKFLGIGEAIAWKLRRRLSGAPLSGRPLIYPLNEKFMKEYLDSCVAGTDTNTLYKEFQDKQWAEEINNCLVE